MLLSIEKNSMLTVKNIHLFTLICRLVNKENVFSKTNFIEFNYCQFLLRYRMYIQRHLHFKQPEIKKKYRSLRRAKLPAFTV